MDIQTPSLKHLKPMKFSFCLALGSFFLLHFAAMAQSKWPTFTGGKITVINGVEAEKRFKISDRLGSMHLHGKPEKVKVALIEGKDIHMPRLLDTDWGKFAHILVINGNLEVDSSISLVEGRPDLLVLGNLKAPFFYVGDAHQRITGAADIRYAIIAGGNDGSLHINGRSTVPYVISMDHDVSINAPDAEWFDWNEGTLKELSREVYNPVQDQVDFGRMEKMLEAGQSIKRNPKRDTSFKGIWKDWLDLYGRDSVLLDFSSFTDFLEEENMELSFQYYDGYELPVEVFTLPNLEELLCTHVKLKSLSANIRQCKKLKKLDLTNCMLERIPAEIGQLSTLEELWLIGNPLKTLPESIFGLKKLQQLFLDSGSFDKKQQQEIKKRLPNTNVMFN